MTRVTKPWLKPKQYYDKSIIVKMTISQYETLNFSAFKLNMTKSDLVRNAINEYLDKHL